MSGSTIGGVVGAAIGFFVPVIGPQVGFMVGSLIGGALDPEVITGPKLTDPQRQTSNDGVPRPIVYGTAAVMGNVIQCQSEPTEHPHTEGGKGGPEQKTFTYTRTCAIRICEAAPLGGEMLLRRVWVNGKLGYDASGSGAIDVESAKFLAGMTFYSGSESQLPNADLEALPAEDGGGVGNVNAHRGTCYVVLRDVDVTQGQGALPVFRWEVSSCGSTVAKQATGQWWMTVESTTPARQNKLWTSADGLSYPTSTTRTPNINPLSGGTGGPLYAGGGQMIIYSTTPENPSQVEVIAAPGTFPITTTVVNVAGDLQAGAVGLFSGTLASPVNAAAQCVFSTDKGASWTVKAGPSAREVMGLGRLSNGRWLCVTGVTGPGNFYYSDAALPASTDWQLATGTVNGTYALWTDGSTGVRFGNLGNVWRTADGETWLSSAHGLGAVAPFAGIGFGGTFLIGEGGSPTVLRSTDSGVTWARITISGTSPGHVAKLDRDPISGTIVASLSPGLVGAEVWVSTDGGASWTQATIPFSTNFDDEVRVGFYPFYELIGIQMPDAPDYYVDPATGIVTGPTGGSITACMPGLDEIAADFCERVGVTDYDVSALSADEVIGYAITQPTDAAGAIRGLQAVYNFDVTEYGNSGDIGTKLRAVKRGGASVLNLSDDALVDVEDDEDTRAQAVEFPRKLNLMAPDPDLSYEIVKQTSERVSENVKAVGEVNVSTSVIFTPDQRAQVADIALRVLWEEAAGKAVVTVPEEYTQYVTSDIITRNSKRYRIDRIGQGDGTSRWELTRDRASAYSSNATAGTILAPPAPTGSARGPTLCQPLNLPSLKSSDNQPGVYVPVCGVLPGWNGCDLYLSVDGGVTEQKVATLIDPAIMGTLTADMATGDVTMAVSLYNDDELDTVTPDQIDARLNAVAVTSAGVSEIIQFQTATDTGTKAYDLTDLTRPGLNTTEAAHTTGDSFVVLDQSVAFIPITAPGGTELIFRAVSRGTTPANNATVSLVFDPPTFIRDGGVVTP